MTPDELEIEIDYQIEVMYDLLDEFEFTTTGFMLHILAFNLRYFESIGNINKEVHYQAIEKMHGSNPRLKKVFQEMITFMSDFKERVYELEND